MNVAVKRLHVYKRPDLSEILLPLVIQFVYILLHSFKYIFYFKANFTKKVRLKSSYASNLYDVKQCIKTLSEIGNILK